MAAAAAAYRRKQQQDPSQSPRPPPRRQQQPPFSFPSELEEEQPNPNPNSPPSTSTSTSTSTSSTSTSTSILAAKAIKASSAHMDSSLSSAYLLSSPLSSPSPSSSITMDSNPHHHHHHHEYTYTSIKNEESKHGFWGSLARKAKSILDDDHHHDHNNNVPQTSKYHNSYHHTPETATHPNSHTPTPSLHKGLGAIASSLNSIGGAIGNAFEGGLTVVENRTADIIQETRKLHIRRKGSNSHTQNQAKDVYTTRQQPSLQTKMQPRMQTDQDIQLKASRDVAMAMAAKAKLLLRELKTVKADLAFAKDRCAQLEEENRSLRENREKGSNLEDDDLIRLQLETLLAEKARLAQENSVYARENRFLREIVEYHQLTMQDVVYLNEGTEEVTEVYPIRVPSVTNSLFVAGTSPTTPSSRPAEAHRNISLQMNQDVFPVPMPPMEYVEISKSAALQGSDNINPAEDSKSRSIPSA